MTVRYLRTCGYIICACSAHVQYALRKLAGYICVYLRLYILRMCNDIMYVPITCGVSWPIIIMLRKFGYVRVYMCLYILHMRTDIMYIRITLGVIFSFGLQSIFTS